MRRAEPEEEQALPRLDPRFFTQENSAREQDLDTFSHEAMMYLRGNWKLVGWAFAKDVAPRDLCHYVIMCDREGRQLWCHCSNFTIEEFVEIITRDPKKLTAHITP